MGCEINLKCKDFDSWVSFLGRLAKIGHDYIIKNDVFIATEKNTIASDSNDKYPGRHIIKDPLSIDDESCYVIDGAYALDDIDTLIKSFKAISENVEDARKNIIYSRDKDGIYITFGIVKPTTLKIAQLLTGETSEIYEKTANSIIDFKSLISPIENMYDNEWASLSQEDLVNIRNDKLVDISHKFENGILATSRLGRSLFCLAGVSRRDTPISIATDYAFLPSDQSDVAMLRLHTMYKCGQSAMFGLECIHEYLVLIYDVGGTEDE